MNDVPKLIVNRRAIAAGLAALLGTPTATFAALQKLTNVPLGFDPSDFTGKMNNGLFLPDYRLPMVRLVFDDGTTTLWHKYTCVRRTKGMRAWNGNNFAECTCDTSAVAIETCAPDKNGNPRFTQLAVG